MAKIYLIYNTKNNKKYVGQTINCVSQRFCQHIDSAFRTYKDKNNKFYEEIKDCGENVFDIFKYSILCECNDKERFDKEIEYIEKIKPEYNENFKQYYLYKIKDKIIKEYNEGKTITELRIKYKCRHLFIANLLKSNNVKIEKSRNQFSKKVYLFDSNGKFIREWLNAGICANELCIDRGNVRLCCIKNTKENILYFSANGFNFKYDKETPKDMYEIINKETNEIKRFKTKQSLVSYFKELYPNKNILYGQLVRDRKSVYGHIIKKLYEHRN